MAYQLEAAGVAHTSNYAADSGCDMYHRPVGRKFGLVRWPLAEKGVRCEFLK